MDASFEELLRTAVASPTKVAAQDREGWLELFAPEGRIEDPVGAGPHLRVPPRGEDQVGLFWDTFIQGNEIHFDVALDRRLGLDLARDVLIHTRFPSGFVLDVPAYLLYELERGEDGLRIQRLAAHWELRKMVAKVLLGGPRAWWAITLLSLRMMVNQRLRGLLGYMKALSVGVFGRGRAAALALAEAVANNDEEALTSLFVDGGARIEIDADRALSLKRSAADALSLLRELRVTDPIACGHTVAARATLAGEDGRRGLLFLEFDEASKKIREAKLFVEGASSAPVE